MCVATRQPSPLITLGTHSCTPALLFFRLLNLLNLVGRATLGYYVNLVPPGTKFSTTGIRICIALPGY
jgi:hypothetical protein